MHADTTHKVGDEGKRAVLTNPMQMINPLLKFCGVLPSQLAPCTWVYPVPRVAWHQTAPLGGFKTRSQRWQRGGTSARLSLGGRCSRVCVQGFFFFFTSTRICLQVWNMSELFRSTRPGWWCCVDFRIITLTPSLHLVPLWAFSSLAVFTPKQAASKHVLHPPFPNMCSLLTSHTRRGLWIVDLIKSEWKQKQIKPLLVFFFFPSH